MVGFCFFVSVVFVYFLFFLFGLVLGVCFLFGVLFVFLLVFGYLDAVGFGSNECFWDFFTGVALVKVLLRGKCEVILRRVCLQCCFGSKECF